MRSSVVMIVAAMFIVGASSFASAQDAKVKKGQDVFTAQKCSTCHSIAGKGGKIAPLDGIGSKLTADETRQWIVDAKGMAAKMKSTKKPPMKNYDTLPKDDVDALVAYLQTLKK